MSAVHLSAPAGVLCNAQRRWPSCVLSGVRGWRLVTCRRCLAMKHADGVKDQNQKGGV